MKKKLQFPIFIISILILSLCLFSCSNVQESKIVYSENDTLKQSVKDREQTITWTQEIEGELLTETITKDSMKIGSDVTYGRELYKISKTIQNPVYPSFYDFGSLDTRSLKASVKEKLDKFCEAFSSEDHKNADYSFSRKFLFNYVFLLKDFEDGWKKNFSKELPEGKAFFTKWIFGQPFNGPDIIQIPVRFYADCGTIDMTVFLDSGRNNEIYQISIDRWKKYDGTR